MAYDLDDAEITARAEAIYDMIHDDTDECFWSVDEWITNRTDFDDERLLDEQDIEDILTEREPMPGEPGWGETRVDYTEFVSGFTVR
jgi:hypothetical protein